MTTPPPSTPADALASRFETHRLHLRGTAYRLLGSLAEADDVVQDAWLRASRADTTAVDNLGAWLTTIVARLCLDRLRARTSRREDPLDFATPDPVISDPLGSSPEQEALLADSVGLALAAREGDIDALVRILDPNVVARADFGRGPSSLGRSQVTHGARAVAQQAMTFRNLAPGALRVLVNGAPGFFVNAGGKPYAVIGLAFGPDGITEIDILLDPDRLARLKLPSTVESRQTSNHNGLIRSTD